MLFTITVVTSSKTRSKVLKKQNCSFEAPHITLGDAFSLDSTSKTENLYTVSVTTQKSCHELPRIILRTSQVATSFEKLPEIDLKPFLKRSINVKIKKVPYQKQTLFYSIDKAHVEAGYKFWEIRQFGDNSSVTKNIQKIPTLAGNDKPARLFVIADMDETAAALPTWAKLDQISAEDFDMIIHVGDFAYEIENNHGQLGDSYFNHSSLSGRRIPYIVTGGNHENFAEGNLFNYRFKMPGADPENSRYDLVYKGTYYMVINLDWILRYLPFDNLEHLSREIEMLKWMQSREALLQNRTDITWRVFMTHRPFECSDTTCPDCGVNGMFFRRIADQAAKMGMHLMVTGHIHSYMRNKLFHALEERSMADVGKGVFLTVINGHAGTYYFFHNETNRPIHWNGLVDRLDLSGTTYLEITVDHESITGRLIRSDTGSINDIFQLTQSEINSRLRTLISLILSTVVFCAVVVLAVILWNNGTVTVADRMLGIPSRTIELGLHPTSEQKLTISL